MHGHPTGVGPAQPGQSQLTTPRKESDLVEVLSGVTTRDAGLTTTGAPLGFILRNDNAKPSDYSHLENTCRRTPTSPARPNTACGKSPEVGELGPRDGVEGGGGQRGPAFLATLGVEVGAYVERVQDISMPLPPSFHSRDEVDGHPVRCPHPDTARRMAERIEEVRQAGDTVEAPWCLWRGASSRLGRAVFDRLHADLAKAMWSLPATKSLELGSGLSGTLMRGTEHNVPS